MKFTLELSQTQKEVLAETIVAEEALSKTLIDASLADNEDAIVSPAAQAQIDTLVGYLDSVKGTVIAPLVAARNEINRIIESSEDLTTRAADMINKSQRATSLRISLLGKRR